MPKTRLNVSLDQDLAEFAKVFAAQMVYQGFCG